jgi:hypothetical protein
VGVVEAEAESPVVRKRRALLERVPVVWEWPTSAELAVGPAEEREGA